MSRKSANIADLSALANVTSIACILKWIPFDVVQETLTDLGRESLRLRVLPTELMFYLCVVWGFYRKDSVDEIYRKLVNGVEFIFGKRASKAPTRAGLSIARSRVGAEPLKLVFGKCCKPLATSATPGAYYRVWRLVALDGFTMNVADTTANSEHFGRPSNQSEKSAAYPQLRMVALGECGTHALFGAQAGVYNDSEIALAAEIIPLLRADMLCLMDRLFFGYSLWKKSAATGAALLWRIRTNVRLYPQHTLPDGSYTALCYPGERNEEDKGGEPILLRVVEYERRGAKGKECERVRLVTNVLEPAQAPAEELAKLYCQRWEIELVYGEMKTRLNENQVYLRSGTPELAQQEAWGLLLAHYCVRASILEAAMNSKRLIDPDDISFIGTVRIIRREMLSRSDFSP